MFDYNSTGKVNGPGNGDYPSSPVPATGPKKKTGTVADAMKRLAQKKDGAQGKNPPRQSGGLSEREFVQMINDMQDDTSRIIAYNRKHYQGEYYGIIDKKSCKLKIYDKQGNVVKTYPVGIGKNKGDNVTFGYKSLDRQKREAGRYTTPGEFTLDEYAYMENTNYVSRRDGKHKIMGLKGDNRGSEGSTQAIHMVPRNRGERIHRLETETPDDNRVSYGCVNLLEDDYNDMANYLCEGYKIYILPEEAGNKLQLEQQSDGSYKFAQKNHKNDARDYSAEEASQVDYDIRPENDPARRRNNGWVS